MNDDLSLSVADALAAMILEHDAGGITLPTMRAARAALAAPAQPAEPWHNPRADTLRAALREIADTKNLTATPTQFARHLQKVACDALTADAMDEPPPPQNPEDVNDHTFRWEQDGAGGDHGAATYYFLGGSVTLRVDTFKKAFELAEAINIERENITREARRYLLREIARIEP
jgi:hypothetical protein